MYRGTTSAMHSQALWDGYFAHQQGGAFFEGMEHQRGGFALGALFKTLARVALPAVKRAGKAVAKQALNTGMSVASDALAGRDVGQSFQEHGKAAAAHLLHKGHKALKKKTTQGKRKRRQKGRGLGIFKARGRGRRGGPKTIKRRRKAGKRYSDALGNYYL